MQTKYSKTEKAAIQEFLSEMVDTSHDKMWAQFSENITNYTEEGTKLFKQHKSDMDTFKKAYHIASNL
jgi:hypothetical protein